jgi:hypothetical protein
MRIRHPLLHPLPLPVPVPLPAAAVAVAAAGARRGDPYHSTENLPENGETDAFWPVLRKFSVEWDREGVNRQVLAAGATGRCYWVRPG